MSLEKNLNRVLEEIEKAALQVGRKGEEITLVAVSKGRTVEEIRAAYFLGMRDFGESRIQEALEKREQLPADIRWHFIGKLQKNKVQKAVGCFALIHSVDTMELATRISRISLERSVKTSLLLESNTSGEATKSGLSPEEWKRHYPELLQLHGIEIHGCMTMAPLTENEGEIRECFSRLRKLQQALQEMGGDLQTLSMGMTHDFKIAIQEGATLVRIGTALFMPQC